jgi:hypothetical protein
VRLDGGYGEAAERKRTKDLSGRIEVAPLRIGRFRNRGPRKGQGREPERHHQEEDTAPAEAADQQPTETWANGQCQSVAGCPYAQSSPAFLRVTPDDPYDRKRRRQQQSSTDPRKRSSADQDGHGGSKSA